MAADRIARFTELVAAQPDNPLFQFSLAQALDAAGRLDDAAGHYRHCCAARADWMMPRILLGKLELRAGRPAAARLVLDEALELAVALNDSRRYKKKINQAKLALR